MNGANFGGGEHKLIHSFIHLAIYVNEESSYLQVKILNHRMAEYRLGYSVLHAACPEHGLD